MKFELDEIIAADPQIGEDEKLAERLQLLQNSEMIFEKLATAYELLYEQTPSSQDCLQKHQASFRKYNHSRVILTVFQRLFLTATINWKMLERIKVTKRLHIIFSRAIKRDH